MAFPWNRAVGGDIGSLVSSKADYQPVKVNAEPRKKPQDNGIIYSQNTSTASRSSSTSSPRRRDSGNIVAHEEFHRSATAGTPSPQTRRFRPQDNLRSEGPIFTTRTSRDYGSSPTTRPTPPSIALAFSHGKVSNGHQGHSRSPLSESITQVRSGRHNTAASLSQPQKRELTSPQKNTCSFDHHEKPTSLPEIQATKSLVVQTRAHQNESASPAQLRVAELRNPIKHRDSLRFTGPATKDTTTSTAFVGHKDAERPQSARKPDHLRQEGELER
eukprot:gene8329-875_t